MKALSYWAKNNPYKARIIITCSHIMLFIIAINLGILLYYEDFKVPYPLLLLLTGLLAVLILIYPSAKKMNGYETKIYYRRKSVELGVVSIGFFMLTLCTNYTLQKKVGHQYYSSETRQATFIVLDHIPSDKLKSNKTKRKTLKHKIKNLKKRLKQKIKKKKKRYKKNKRLKSQATSNFGKAILILLSLLLGVLLLYIVAALACTLSCNGAEAAAAIVGIGGAILVIMIVVGLIKKITRKEVENLESSKTD